MEAQGLIGAHWVLICSLFTGLAYCVLAIYYKKLHQNSLSDLFVVMLASASIINGFKLSLVTIVKSQAIRLVILFEDSEVPYTIMGGIAVVWIAAWELANKFKSL
jgi:hypothetical protein